MALAIYSGKDAYVDDVPCTENWALTEAVAATKYAASCTNGGTNTPKGISNWSGSIGGIGAHPVAVIPTGVDLPFKGVVNNDAGQGDLLSVDGTILIEQLTIDINKETGAPIMWTASFGMQGVPTESATGAADATIANPEHGDALDIKIGGTTIEAASVKARTAQLVIRRPHTTYPAGGSTLRKAGNLEADGNFAIWSPKLLVAAFATNVLARLQLYTGVASYWDLSKARFGAKTGHSVKRTSPPIIGYSVAFGWNAADAGVMGYLSYYDGTTAHDYFGDSTP